MEAIGKPKPPGPAANAPAPTRTRDEMWVDLAEAAWSRSQQATTPEDALRWLERARRILPQDDTIALGLAARLLSVGDAARAAPLFQEVADRWDARDAWVGLATSLLRCRDPAGAAKAMAAALSGHVMDGTTPVVAAAVALASGAPGWCAVGQGARFLHADGPAEIAIDGMAFAARWRGNRCAIPPGASLAVTRGGVHLLGSPIDLRAIGTVEGFVQATEAGGLDGWAWFPRDPARDPVITLHTADGVTAELTATKPRENVRPAPPFARPRTFSVPPGGILAGMVHVAAGRALWGSPLDPGMERRSAAGRDDAFRPVWADVVGPPVTAVPVRRPVDVVVPVYRGVRTVLACLHSVLPTLAGGARLVVVDDGGVDPELGAALDALAAAGRLTLRRLATNRGFPGAANEGLRFAPDRDVVLLNSDTVVPPGWLEGLAEAAYAAPDIGSACPLSNDATILSYPDPRGENPMPDPAPAAALARRANGAATADIPVAVGFCMYIRRDCLDAVGLLREDLWAQGYGEENDWCLRARHRGWRHVAALGCFVAHEGGSSFGAARTHLLARNGALLDRLHPGYGALVAKWIAADPLLPARRRMDALRWRAGRRPQAVVLVTHDSGGGVERVIDERAQAMAATGIRPIVLRPVPGGAVVGDGSTPNLRYQLPGERAALRTLLRADRVARVELHHTLGYDSAILSIAGDLGVPLHVVAHDYASFCPRIALVPEHRYCGEPALAGCEACIADHGSNLEEKITPTALVARSTALLQGTARIAVPSADAAQRLRRHFPAIEPVVTPWEDDAAIPPPPPTRRPVRHVCLIGGIGVEKGLEVLLGCLRDAEARALPLRFTVVGYTADDERVLAAGPVFITGQYTEPEAVALIRAQRADVALLPSVWPETWCFTLGQAWRAGLRATVFDLGAPAERVRRTGWGEILPLGLSPAALNNRLLSGHAAPLAR